MIKKTKLFFALMLLVVSGFSQNPQRQYQDMVYQAFISKNMGIWEQSLHGMEQLFVRKPSASLLYDIILAQYGLTGYYLGIDEEEKAEAIIDKADVNLVNLANMDSYKASAYALEGAFIAYRIALAPMKAVYLGPKSNAAIDKGMEIDKQNPNVWIEKANAAFYAPPVFGGSKSASIDYYKEAIRLLEKNMAHNHRWLYLNTLVALGKAYNDTGQKGEAIRTYNKALSFEPDFLWVKEELLPKLLK
ncbi:MAG: tetratricopeptide repeat protein [Bacteroidales bacterium]|nr:tetratricopeptide repeat protein [Bacteroidales bacterium]